MRLALVLAILAHGATARADIVPVPPGGYPTSEPLDCGPEGYEDYDGEGHRRCYNAYCNTDDDCGPRAGCETVMCLEQPCRRRCIRDVRPMRVSGPARGLACSASHGGSPAIALFIALAVSWRLRRARSPADHRRDRAERDDPPHEHEAE